MRGAGISIWRHPFFRLERLAAECEPSKQIPERMTLDWAYSRWIRLHFWYAILEAGGHSSCLKDGPFREQYLEYGSRVLAPDGEGPCSSNDARSRLQIATVGSKVHWTV